ncbi:MAG: hypothetical protein OEV85_12830 [Candidatus Thorarchaeota archaeon]|nr:hypothetical protein [Candidatus Thorarchaeota archaeon]
MNNIQQELETVCQELDEYYYLRREVIVNHEELTKKQTARAYELHDLLAAKVGAFKNLISDATGIPQTGQEDLWMHAMSYIPTPLVVSSLDQIIQATSLALGKIKRDIELGKRGAQTGELLSLSSPSGSESSEVLTATEGWKAIEGGFGITRRRFGRRISFVSDPFKRVIIFRDVAQAFVLASSGFSKPAVILAGGVIEELLRLYLAHKGVKPTSDTFDGYVQTCGQEGLLKAGISRLSDSVRHFRNLVHLSKEETARHTISKSTAIGAVSSIFTIANDF